MLGFGFKAYLVVVKLLCVLVQDFLCFLMSMLLGPCFPNPKRDPSFVNYHILAEYISISGCIAYRHYVTSEAAIDNIEAFCQQARTLRSKPPKEQFDIKPC